MGPLTGAGRRDPARKTPKVGGFGRLRGGLSAGPLWRGLGVGVSGRLRVAKGGPAVVVPCRPDPGPALAAGGSRLWLECRGTGPGRPGRLGCPFGEVRVAPAAGAARLGRGEKKFIFSGGRRLCECLVEGWAWDGSGRLWGAFWGLGSLGPWGLNSLGPWLLWDLGGPGQAGPCQAYAIRFSHRLLSLLSPAEQDQTPLEGNYRAIHHGNYRATYIYIYSYI